MSPPEVDEAPAHVSARPALAGIVGGLVGATCCIGPAVGVAIGAGSGSFLLAMARFRPLLLLIGALVAFAVALVLVGRRRASCPSEDAFRRLRTRWFDLALIAFAITYGVGRFVVARLIERL